MENIHEFLGSFGVTGDASGPAGILLAIFLLLGLAWISLLISRHLILSTVKRLVLKSKNSWDDILLEHKIFHRLAAVFPAIILHLGAGLFPTAQNWIEKAALAWIIATLLSVINAGLNAVLQIYRTYPVSKTRPIKGYVQVAKIFINLVGAIFIVSILLDKSPWTFLSGLGAMTAVLMLVFKDSILSLVASIQLSANDMVRMGDWIEVPAYGADGDVIDLSLHTVKVQNWDKTISTIPTYALVGDAVKNWRGMSESGGRRIKRSLFIDMNSIRFLQEKDVEHLQKVDVLQEYMKNKSREIAEENENSANLDISTNGRRLTNIGSFRAYVVHYLKKHPNIFGENEMTFLVRQLKPGPQGLPLEIYVFCTDQNWGRYENIQSDIFDHLLAVLPEFGLCVFQEPTGTDFKSLCRDS